MIVVVARVSTDAERRAEVVRIGEKVAAASREEAGCINYRLYQDTESDTNFVVVEEWESNEALQEHFRTPHIAEFMGALGPLLTGAPDVQFHTVSETRGLQDVAGG